MNIYGSKIKSDLAFPLNLPHDSDTRYELELSSEMPEDLKQSITCGFPFYMAHGRKVYLYSDRLFDGAEAGQPWCYEIKGVLRFYWRGGEQKIYYKLDEQGDSNLLSFWFIHLLLPLYFTLENKYDFLHAGAIEVSGSPILFIAPSMGGKSTMTDYFIKQGHTLISDDKVATFINNGQCMAVGSHPYHRPYRKFEELGFHTENFTTSFKPIHAFYSLEAIDRNAEIAIDEIKGAKKFETLLPAYLYMFHFLMPRRLQYLSSILRSTRVFNLKIPWELALQSKVHDAICEHSMEI